MKQYYYSDGLAKHGPFSLEELREMKLSRNTMVSTVSSERWIPAEQMPELEGSFREEGFKSDPVEKHKYPDRRPPKSWLVESILVTVFCCLPFGIVGIVNAARVESRYSCGDYEGAVRSSQEAGKWTQIGFWIAVAGFVIYMIFLAFAFVFNQF
ncbi:CD225/dispanin family protein [Salinimicrobium flavum]|uniref:CD225/dispanin family protein n=1 Tax=Salinimicrobium flavum TaxID=1737065 RepID=A0ABW5J0V5_9FLAO